MISTDEPAFLMTTQKDNPMFRPEPIPDETAAFDMRHQEGYREEENEQGGDVGYLDVDILEEGEPDEFAMTAKSITAAVSSNQDDSPAYSMPIRAAAIEPAYNDTATVLVAQEQLTYDEPDQDQGPVASDEPQYGNGEFNDGEFVDENAYGDNAELTTGADQEVPYAEDPDHLYGDPDAQ